MKKAFTMIELIFVIVIIGIISAIALPKFNATRDDAQVSTMIKNARIAVQDIGNYIAAVGITNIGTSKIEDASNIDFSGSGCANLDENTTNLVPSLLTLCDYSVSPPSSCIVIVISANGDTQVINDIGSSDSLCQTVASDPAIISLAGAPDDPAGKVYHFAGKRITR
jgi:prepilin-type N-terminal cleavage/methylation domain-containing protein